MITMASSKKKLQILWAFQEERFSAYWSQDVEKRWKRWLMAKPCHLQTLNMCALTQSVKPGTDDTDADPVMDKDDVPASERIDDLL